MVDMTKMIIFDMDGTIADLYRVENWLTHLENENPLPYQIAKPMYNMKELNKLIRKLKEKGFRIAVTSWLSKGGGKEFNKKVRQAKREWLKEYEFEYDEIHLVKYGTNKAYVTKGKANFQILVDDNKDIRKDFRKYNGNVSNVTINAEKDIMEELYRLLQ